MSVQKLFQVLSLSIFVCCLLACVSQTEPDPVGTAVTPRATPAAQLPAAGICPQFEGDILRVTIHPDIPAPRCAEIRPEQQLQVENRRAETIQVKLGLFDAELAPGDTHLFDVPLGDYLAPGGVHRVVVEPCCGFELWLKEP